MAEAIWTLDREHQGCPCHAWRSPVHDSPTTRERPRPHADIHRVASPVRPINPIAVPLYLAIGPLSFNPAINPSCTRKGDPPTLRFCFFVVEHCPAHTDTFLSQRRPSLSPSSIACAYPGHIGAPSCFCFEFSTQTVGFHNVFCAFLRLGMCISNNLELHLIRPSPNCRPLRPPCLFPNFPTTLLPQLWILNVLPFHLTFACSDTAT
jgi:hypothetical protein